MTTPLPPVKDDPAIRSGYTTQHAYPQALAEARAKTNITDIDRARLINRIWRQTLTDLVAARTDLDQRRAARIAHIETQLPVGPGIDPNTSPADKAVLIAAWNNALTAAREADTDQRRKMLTDAQRFGDDTTLRATLTTAVDDGQWDVIDHWGGNYNPDTKALFHEWRHLRAMSHGRSFQDALWEAQALRPPAQPPESKALASLVQAHNNSVMAFNRTKGQLQLGRRLLELDDGETTPGPYDATT